MTDELIERIKADREAGTGGDWPINDGMNSRPIEVAACYLAHFSGGQGAAKHQKANTRRIARVPDIEARILADAKIIEAAEALARQFEIALCELRCFFADFPGVDYNCPDHNAAIAVYRAAMGARK